MNASIGAASVVVYPDARNPFAFTDLLDKEGLQPWRVKEVWVSAYATPDHFVDITDTFDLKIKALQGYYEDIVDLVDTYVESYQGRYGILKGYKPTTQIFEDDSTLRYFAGLLSYVDNVRKELPQDGELNNILDEISGLISSTHYKLKFLK